MHVRPPALARFRKNLAPLTRAWPALVLVAGLPLALVLDPGWEPARADEITAALDSGRISYVRALDNQWDVFLSNPDGDQESRLTNTGDRDDGYEQDPRWSPDGRELAYHTYDGRKATIWRVLFSGGTPTPVVTDRGGGYQSGFPSWHPTLDCIAFSGVREGGSGNDLKLWCADSGVRPLLSTAERNESTSDWSPDGQLLAYEAEPAGDDGDGNSYWDIRIVNADGSGDRELIAWEGSSERHPRWSPDGTRLAFMVFYNPVGMGDGSLWVFETDTGDVMELVRGVAGPPAWSPDGTQILFTTIKDDGPRPVSGIAPVDPTAVPGSEQKGLYMVDLSASRLARLKGGAGGVDATPGAYEWGYGPDWTAGTVTPTPLATDTPTSTNTPVATDTSTPTATPDKPTPTSRPPGVYVPITYRTYPTAMPTEPSATPSVETSATDVPPTLTAVP